MNYTYVTIVDLASTLVALANGYTLPEGPSIVRIVKNTSM